MGSRDNRIYVRLGVEERRALDEACASLGCTVSEYVRCALAAYTLVYNETGEAPETVGLDARVLADLYTDVRRQGVNLNQAAHALNTVAAVARADGPLDPAGADLARACLEEVSRALPALVEEVSRTQLCAEEMMRRRAVGIPSKKGARACR